jgi:hypothetical protein
MDLSSVDMREKAIRRMGEAVVRVWSELPKDVQHQLFEAAVGPGEDEVRAELARFLREMHVRTTDALKARALWSPTARVAERQKCGRSCQ